jgi:hypothetical protein
MSKPNEIWRVQIAGHQLETDLEALKVLICQGEVTPQHKVAKGSLNWIEAGRVPALRRVFTGEETLEEITAHAARAAAETPATVAFASPMPLESLEASPVAVMEPPPAAANEPPPAATYVAGIPLPAAAPEPPAQDGPSAAFAPPQEEVSASTVWEYPPAETYQPTPQTAYDQNQPSQQADPSGYAPAAEQGFHPHEYYSGHEAGPHWQPPREHAYTPSDYAAGPNYYTEPGCYQHPDVPPKYVCRGCHTLACRECVKMIGSAPLCNLCGELCQAYTEVKIKARRQAEISSGFGFSDFGTALAYPFKNAGTLFVAALFYAFALLGGLMGQIVAFGLMYGFITRVIKQVAAQGNEAGSVYNNTEFAVWDDVLAPFGRGICVIIVTYGPLLALVIMLVMGVIGGVSMMEKQAQEAAAEQAKISKSVDDLMSENSTPQQQEEALRRIRAAQMGQPIPDNNNPVAGAPAKTNDSKSFEALAPLLMLLSPVFILAFLLACVWAFFYYPAAIAVAGYTESAGAVLNPLVGLDTIKRMGLDYLKAFGMYAFIAFAGGLFSVIAATILAPFDLPLVGNLPATFASGVVTFYANMAIACVLGLALYKCSGRLGLATD